MYVHIALTEAAISKVKRKTLKRIFYIALISAISLASCSHKKGQDRDIKPKDSDTTAVIITQAQRQSKLYTTEYNIHKIVTYSDVVSVKGSLFSNPINVNLPLGDRKIAIPIYVTAKAYIDFSKFDAANVNRKGSSITIILPDPKVEITASRIDHKETKEFIALTRQRFSQEEKDRIAKKGKESIEKNLSKTDILSKAKESAARILVPMLVNLGYKDADITISFRKDFTQSEWKSSILERIDEKPQRP